MKNQFLPNAEKYTNANRRKRVWRRVMTVLASIVVFCTTYALILPAITLEKGNGCQIEEHEHTDNCYRKASTVEKKVLNCTAKPHEHTTECYRNGDLEDERICGKADYFLHEHDMNCYDPETGELVCEMDELLPHIHDDGCYVIVYPEGYDPNDESTWWPEDIYGEDYGVAAQGMDEDFGIAAFGLDEDFSFGVDAETEGGAESDDYYYQDQGGWIVVDDREDEEGFMEWAPEVSRPTDDMLEDFDSSFGVDQEPGWPELVCKITETPVHEHGAWCYSQGDGVYPGCGMIERVWHEHTDECFDTEMVPDPNKDALTCKNTDPNHEHTERCYGTWVLSCGKEAHKHTEDCGKEPDPTYYCGWEAHAHTEDCYDANGKLTCVVEEHTHTENCTDPNKQALSLEEVHANEAAFTKEVEALELKKKADILTDDDQKLAEELKVRLRVAYQGGEITKQVYTELISRIADVFADPDEENHLIGEMVEDLSAWEALVASGYFEKYSEYADLDTAEEEPEEALMTLAAFSMRAITQSEMPSAQQIDEQGGEVASSKGDGVKIGKTIAGTELENVFDITLKVQTPRSVSEIYTQTDAAVVVVMDISATMLDTFTNKGVTVDTKTRYEAAMEAADLFLEQFAENNTSGTSKVGYVAFNTDAHKIFDMQSCTESQVDMLKGKMRTGTNAINNGYAKEWDTKNKKWVIVDHDRFTNIEAGLKMARDMLATVDNKNKFIIFLSDGFPTTYLLDSSIQSYQKGGKWYKNTGYSGYDPYSDGSGTKTDLFFDYTLNKPCTYGTSYSDKAAAEAQKMAKEIKDTGIKIFSVGVNVEGQDLSDYIKSGNSSYSIVERAKITNDSQYVIGGVKAANFENWLKNSIGSGYYYSSTNSAALKEAYANIFATIKETLSASAEADWVATDPIPFARGVNGVDTRMVEFIGLYDKDNNLNATANEQTGKIQLSGSHAEKGENTASFADTEQSIRWDLKNSGYTAVVTGSGTNKTTTYTYTLKYRVRLKNETAGFVEDDKNAGTTVDIYPTNGNASLSYRVVETKNSKLTLSEVRTLAFPVPSVHGHLGELEFTKVNNHGDTLAGAEFTLTHADSCKICRGDGTRVTIEPMTATSDENGVVTFENVPSGHVYSMKETVVPVGHVDPGFVYTVTVAYDETTVTVKTSQSGNSDEVAWTGKVLNNTSYELPDTGGEGTTMYTAGGLLLIAAAAFGLYNSKKRKKEAENS